MPMFEGKQAIRQVEEELERRWTRYRSQDMVKVISGHDEFIGKVFTIRYPYYFLVDNEQAYIMNETVYPFKESELEFVKQKTYIMGGE